jgi:PAS domain S-box-containing protein
MPWQEAPWASILSVVGALVVVLDRRGGIVFFNRACEETTGYTATEVQGRVFFDFLIAPEDIAGVRAVFAELRAGQFPNRHENAWIAKDGTRRRIAWSNTAVLDTRGDVVFVIGTGLDVTERRKAEQQIERAKREWEQTFDAVPDLIAIIDTCHRVVRVNRALAERTGRTPASLVGAPCCEVLHGLPCTPPACPLSHLLADGHEHTSELPIEHLGGYFSVSVTPLRGADGVVWGAVHVARDISAQQAAAEVVRNARDELESRVQERTAELAAAVSRLEAEVAQRQRTEEALREAEFRYRTVADFTYDWEYWRAPGGHLLYVSPSCEGITGHAATEFLARPDLLESLVVPEDRALWASHRERIGSGTVHDPIEFRIRRRSGDVRWIDHICRPVTGADGEFLGWRGSNRDVTDRKRAEDEIARQRAELAHAGRVNALGELVASLAHEVGQPMTAALNNAETGLRLIGRDGTDIAEIREILSDIADDGHRANAIIARLRDMVRRTPATPAPFGIGDVLRDAARLLHGDLAHRGIRLDLRSGGEVPTVRGDPVQILQVLMNLMTNACEAMSVMPPERRSLEVGVSLPESGTVVVSVRDTGPGLDPELKETVFDPFFTTKREGTGMGLSICRKIVEAHGGRIWGDNHTGGGAVFHFSLPTAERDEGKQD